MRCRKTDRVFGVPSELQYCLCSAAQQERCFHQDVDVANDSTLAWVDSVLIKPSAEAQEAKQDKGKPPLDLLPWAALLAVSEVQAFGVQKYSAGSWRTIESHRWIAAGLRHVAAYQMGETVDVESGLPHLAHAACCFLYAAEMEGHDPNPRCWTDEHASD